MFFFLHLGTNVSYIVEPLCSASLSLKVPSQGLFCREYWLWTSPQSLSICSLEWWTLKESKPLHWPGIDSSPLKCLSPETEETIQNCQLKNYTAIDLLNFTSCLYLRCYGRSNNFMDLIQPVAWHSHLFDLNRLTPLGFCLLYVYRAFRVLLCLVVLI